MSQSLITDRQALVRAGHSDYDTYGRGYASAATGALDAPEWIPQGSVRLHSTGAPVPALSAGHRDWDGALPPGAAHDGPETAASVRHWWA